MNEVFDGIVAGMSNRRGAGNLRRLFLVVALLFAGMGSVAAAQQMPKLKTGGQFPPIFEYVYRHFAIQEGFFEDQGIDAEFTGFTAGLTGMKALVAGSVDVACEGMAGTMGAIRQGGNIKIVVIVNADNTYVVATRDAIAGPEDIPGKRWAISSMGAVSQTYAALWAEHYGLNPDDIRWTPIGGVAARSRALLAGQVDAALLTLGEWTRIKNEPGVKNLDYLSDVVPPLPISTCSVSTDLIEKQPDVVQGYVNGVINAVRYAHTEEGKQAYIALAKEYDESMTDEQLDEVYEYYFFENPLAMDPNGGMYPHVIQESMQLLVEDGTLSEPLPLTQVWEPKFVNQYLAENGWFSKETGESGLFLKDLIRR